MTPSPYPTLFPYTTLSDLATGIPNTNEARVEEDVFATKEYRTAFMDFCKTGVMNAEYRIDAFTSTVEAAAIIPTTIMAEIVKKLESYGSIYAKIRKLNVAGGVSFPILSLKPVATWITQATPSDRKQLNTSTTVSFSYFGLECKVASSLIVNLAKLPAFESTFANLAVEAMVKAIDISVVAGVGTTQPLGIINDVRVPAGQIITLSAADFQTWEGWKKKIFAKIPLSYRAGGSWIMAAGTFDGYIDGMVDANGQPIARTNYGIIDAAQERFGGREVLLVEEDVMLSYDAAANGDVVAVFVRLSDYGFNSNLQMNVYRWLDQDLNQWVDKVIMVADGKLIDANGVVIVKKGA